MSGVADRVIVALGILMVVVYTVVMHHQATLDPHSVWCDPSVMACVYHGAVPR